MYCLAVHTSSWSSPTARTNDYQRNNNSRHNKSTRNYATGGAGRSNYCNRSGSASRLTSSLPAKLAGVAARSSVSPGTKRTFDNDDNYFSLESDDSSDEEYDQDEFSEEDDEDDLLDEGLENEGFADNHSLASDGGSGNDEDGMGNGDGDEDENVEVGRINSAVQHSTQGTAQERSKSKPILKKPKTLPSASPNRTPNALCSWLRYLRTPVHAFRSSNSNAPGSPVSNSCTACITVDPNLSPVTRDSQPRSPSTADLSLGEFNWDHFKLDEATAARYARNRKTVRFEDPLITNTYEYNQSDKIVKKGTKRRLM